MSSPAWIAAGAAVAAAAAGWWAAVSASKTLARQREDSRNRSRPIVVAELRDHGYAPATQILVVRNYGLTVARNLRVTFDPAIPDPADPDQSATPFLKKRYDRAIPMLSPGMELDNIWYSGRPDGAGWKNFEPIPDLVTVHVEYDGPEGAHYADDFPLDVGIISQRTFVVASNDPVEIAKNTLTTLKAIDKAIRRLKE